MLGKTTHKFLRGAGRKQITSEHAAKPSETFFPSPGSKGGLKCLKIISFPNVCELSWVGDGAGEVHGSEMTTGCPAGKWPKGTSSEGSSLVFTVASGAF